MQWNRDSLVVRSKRLNLALQDDLTLRETRVLQLAVINVRNNITEQRAPTPVNIHASQYSHYFGADAGYIALAQVAEKLDSRKFVFLDDDSGTHNWCDKVEYQEGLGVLKLSLSRSVMDELPTNPNDWSARNYTSYRLESCASLTSVYAVRMFEILSQWRLLKTTPWIEITTLRGWFGLPDDRYTRMSDFKRLVIDQSINKINALTTIHATYLQKKSGKTITHIQFQFYRTNRRGQPPTPAQLKAEYLASVVNKTTSKEPYNDY